MDIDEPQLIVKWMMPFAAAASIFLIVFLGSSLFADLRVNAKLEDPGFIISGFFIFVAAGAYCFRYCHVELGYFDTPFKTRKQLVLLVIVPLLVGLSVGIQLYNSRIEAAGLNSPAAVERVGE